MPECRNMNKTHLFQHSKEELITFLQTQGQPKFRARQITELALKGYAFSAMQTLPKALRELLDAQFIAQACTIHAVFRSQIDDTVKFLFALFDGHIIEGVLMKYHYGYTLCISTQVGCRMGCKFCASTLNGCVRNLYAAEMLGQIIAANKFLGDAGHVGHVVLMGSGEALDNYDETLRFLHMAHDEELLHISYRNISLSTCGLVPEMLRFIDEGIPVTLSISLHATNDEKRKEIMPIAKAYSLPELMGAAHSYVKKTGRRVIFEYAVMEGVNSSREDAEALAKLLKNLQCHVNVIPLNKVGERDLEAPSQTKINQFIACLENLGISVSKRRSMGNDIEGACGQLRHKVLDHILIKTPNT